MRSLVTLAAILCLAAPVRADLFTLDALHFGNYNNDGGNSLQNFTAGHIFTGGVRNNYVVFNLSSIAPGSITSAILRIPSVAYGSDDPTETYTLFDVVTPVGALFIPGGIRTDIFVDLQSGQTYGSRVFTPADQGQTVDIPLTAAALTDMNQAGDFFAIGGEISTLGPFSMRSQLLFDGPRDSQLPQLIVTGNPSPEPSTLVLAIIGLTVGAFHLRRSKRAKGLRPTRWYDSPCP